MLNKAIVYTNIDLVFLVYNAIVKQLLLTKPIVGCFVCC